MAAKLLIKANVVNAVLHLDEQTPHIYVSVVIINAADSFAAKLAPLGLQRG